MVTLGFTAWCTIVAHGRGFTQRHKYHTVQVEMTVYHQYTDLASNSFFALKLSFSSTKFPDENLSIMFLAALYWYRTTKVYQNFYSKQNEVTNFSLLPSHFFRMSFLKLTSTAIDRLTKSSVFDYSLVCLKHILLPKSDYKIIAYLCEVLVDVFITRSNIALYCINCSNWDRT